MKFGPREAAIAAEFPPLVPFLEGATSSPTYFGVVSLPVAGLGLLVHSPSSAAQVPRDASWLHRYTEQIDSFNRAGTLVGFNTGEGDFVVAFARGRPSALALPVEAELGLALRVDGGTLHVRDVHDLIRWSVECPDRQVVHVEDGLYSMTIVAHAELEARNYVRPISVFLEPVPALPRISSTGVPYLCG